MDALIFLNKDKDISSAGALNQLKKKFHIKSMGHAGTLDPFATGLLIVATNRATKLLPYFQDLPKEYRAKVELGIQTDTDDRTGEIIARSHKNIILEEELPKILSHFQGWIDQVPPIYSALKINGERAYKLARENKMVEMESRKVHIHEIKIEEMNTQEQTFTMLVRCAKGTYIRSLARDMGEMLGTKGILKELSRTAIGSYNLSMAHTVSQIEEKDFQNIEDIFSHYPALEVKKEFEKNVFNGAPILGFYLNLEGGEEGYSPSYYRLYNPHKVFMGIVNCETRHFLYKV